MFMGGPWGCGDDGRRRGSVHLRVRAGGRMCPSAQRVGARAAPRSPARRQGRPAPQLDLGDDLGERQPGAHHRLGVVDRDPGAVVTQLAALMRSRAEGVEGQAWVDAMLQVKHQKDRLEHAYGELRRAEMLRDSLTQMIVHDLKSPLTAILGTIGLLAGWFPARTAANLKPVEALRM